MTKIIGLTGGIGSGKTTVAHIFSDFGVPVYTTDLEARNLMRSDFILDQIKNTFGNGVFENGVLLREKLSEIVFNNPEKLEQLNSIVHPAVKDHFKRWLSQQSFPYIIYESAVLFESGSYQQCDQIINVVAPLETRIKRVMERDNITREKVLARIQNQWSDEQKSLKSNFVLQNTSLASLKLEIVKILNFLRIKQIKS